MKTPVYDFVRKYSKKRELRLHMPGHKGKSFLGPEALDITEIEGADSLYDAEGIIARSEENASRIFGASTFYSTEGSSQCIRAMLYLALLHAGQTGRKPLIYAARNVHKTFLSAAALLDLEVTWLYPERMNTYLSCQLTAGEVERLFAAASELPVALYVTSPDYLGCMTDIAALAKVCHRYGVLLAVDNAHGAYLRFLDKSLHPVDLGADLCCDSAHKTLPALTGGAYLHISNTAPASLAEQAKNALALFGSTSPSYLILQSLDLVNAYLEDYPRRLQRFLKRTAALKARLEERGYCLYGGEPLKITIQTKKSGYTGQELASLLLEDGIVCEFADPDYLVLMLTPETGSRGLKRIEKALLAIPQKPAVDTLPPLMTKGMRLCSIRQAMLAPAERIPVEESCGRILAAASVGCPPAVPVLICGERIDEAAVECFRYYGIEKCMVICQGGEGKEKGWLPFFGND